ncbi:MAG: formylglycine-generating enzyme family protein [Ignavibacteriaceae bacterium]|nr:formylglycine-generating enzyme family protein [Ignavibacteriaceae bacterium]
MRKTILVFVTTLLFLISGCDGGLRLIIPNPYLWKTSLIFVQGGTFTMGCTSEQEEECVYDEKPTSQVTVSSFYIGKYEVTQIIYQEVMGTNPSFWKGENFPVERVSWYNAVTFCNALSEREGLKPVYLLNGDKTTADWSANGYRLPTEAEWEYAARGGINAKGTKYSGSNNAGDVGWYVTNNSGIVTKFVGTKQPNELGIFDMSGNVWEWCWDWYGGYTSNTKTDPTGASLGNMRVTRGGGFLSNAVDLRISSRYRHFPSNDGNGILGFRVVRMAEKKFNG